MNPLSTNATLLALLSPGRCWTSAPEPSFSRLNPTCQATGTAPAQFLLLPPLDMNLLPLPLPCWLGFCSRRAERGTGSAPGSKGACTGSQTGGQPSRSGRQGEGRGIQKHSMFLHLKQEKNDSAFQKPETQQNKGGNDEPSLGQTKFEMLEGCLADSCSSRCSLAERSA